ncbi:MAG: alpha/beta fold hydrolase [Vicingaceae bacterium]
MKQVKSFCLSLVILGSTALMAQEIEEKVNTEPPMDVEKPEVKKQVTLADIWRDYTFRSKGVYGLRSMNDGKHYTVLERGSDGRSLVKYKYSNGKKVKTLIAPEDLKYEGKTLSLDAYEFSADESKVLIADELESIYRRSTKANYYVLDLKSKKLQKLSEGNKQMYADFSPNGSKVAFVKDNNLYYKDLENGKETQITTDGEYNKIINGASDWVYEEELSLSQAFQWSPDGKRIAFYRFDESAVKQWNMKLYDDLYPTDYRFKYPKAGEENAQVGIKIHDLEKGKTIDVKLTQDYEYLPSIQWTEMANFLAVMSTNRHQNDLQINLVNAEDGSSKVIHNETSETYLEMPFEVYFTKNKKSFLIQSEKSGFRHLYLYKMDGSLQKQLTAGNWPVTELYGVDDENGFVYYQAAEKSPLGRNVYRIDLDGKNKKRLSSKEGTNSATFSKSFSYFINKHSTANTPTYTTLNNASGKEIRVLEANESLNKKLEEYQLSKKEFFRFKTSEGVELNGWMIKPADYNPNQQYPAFLTIYGGPGSQTVTNAWGGSNYFWHQMLAQQGYIVVSVDNRGTGARGVDFKKVTYKQLGKYETMDQIETAKYLASQPYIDGNRIGVQGWSYGGYMSSLCLLKGAEHFKAAIAVAPVTNWRFYDSIYTERYMQTPQENADGYDDNSPINHVEKLEGKYLLVHGMADDNVHLQNTSEMITALVEADKQFDLFMYPNKNHGIYGGNTRYHLYKKMTTFLKENL